MRIDLTELFAAQKELDQHIQSQHHVTYASTREKRLLALLVEVGEMINETRAFKFWSKKGPSETPIILDEYADGMHFFLSLGLDINSEKYIYDIPPRDHEIVGQTLHVYETIMAFKKEGSVTTFEAAFLAYLSLIPHLGFDTTMVVEGYFKKLGVNYTRQKTNY